MTRRQGFYEPGAVGNCFAEGFIDKRSAEDAVAKCVRWFDWAMGRGSLGAGSKMVTRWISCTVGEGWQLVRRRRGNSQAAEAAARELSTARYARMERDTGASRIEVSEPEWCYLQRMRSGWTLGELSVRMGLATRWLNRAERGEVDPAPLSAWWDRQLDEQNRWESKP